MVFQNNRYEAKDRIFHLHDSAKHMVRQPTYFYLLFLRLLTNFSINLSIEKRQDLLSFFQWNIALSLWGFCFLCNNCQYVLYASERVSLWWSKRQVQLTSVQIRIKHTNNDWTKNKNPIAVMLCSFLKNKEDHVFSP